METKRCSKCKEVKVLEEFYRMTASKDGRCVWCKQCMNEHQRQYHAANLEKLKEYDREYGKRYYSEHREEKREYDKGRRKEMAKHNARWRANNPDYHHQYRIDNADKYRAHTANRHALSMAAEGTFTDEQFAELCKQHGNCCLCCGEVKKLTVDHIIPLSKGGSNDISNIQPLCLSCNASKGAKTIDYQDAKRQEKQLKMFP